MTDIEKNDTAPEIEEAPKEETKKTEEAPKSGKKASKSEKKAPEPKKKSSAKDEEASWASRFCKKNELPIILVSLVFSFTLLFFSPLDIFLGNQREFVVDFKHVAIPMALSAAFVTLVLIALLNLFLAIHKKICQVFTSAFFGVTLAGYVQSLFLNSKMAAVTGDTVNYKNDNDSVTINLIVFCAISAAPLLLTIISWFVKGGVFKLANGKLIPYVCGLIFLMQAAGTASSAASADFGKYKRLYTSYLSYDGTTDLSEDGNVVVFLVDRLDSLWMDRVIQEYPDVMEKFEGFTFYQNNISHNTNTFPSIPSMLTHSPYKGNDWSDYVSDAWDGDTVPKELKENGYDVNLLIDNLTTYGSTAQLEGQCDNIRHCEPEDVKYNYLGVRGIVPTMAQLSLAKLSPYIWKTELVNGFGASPSSDFITYKTEVTDMLPMAINKDTDIKYFDYIKSHEFTTNAKNKTFSFVHLNGAHDPEREIADFYDKDAELDRWVTIRGDFEILFYYFDKMKELGVYDNSTIIVLGDHGRAPREIEVDDLDVLTSPIVTALLVKPAGETREYLSFDRYSEQSLDFFSASVLEYAGIDHEKFGTSFKDVVDKKLHPDRYLQTYDFHGYGKTVYKTLYKVTGDARDFDNWEAQPEHE